MWGGGGGDPRKKQSDVSCIFMCFILTPFSDFFSLPEISFRFNAETCHAKKVEKIKFQFNSPEKACLFVYILKHACLFSV